MQITVLGQTDKRPVIYTILKMCENLGDCCYVTNDRKAMRLMEDGPDMAGTYRNIDVFITDATADDLWAELATAPYDYEYIILDNLYNDQTDVIIYVKGAGDEEVDQMVLDALNEDEYFVIKMGKPEKKGGPLQKGASGPKTFNVAYTVKMLEAIEHCEFFKQIVPIGDDVSKACAAILHDKARMTARNMVAVAKRPQTGQGGGKK